MYKDNAYNPLRSVVSSQSTLHIFGLVRVDTKLDVCVVEQKAVLEVNILPFVFRRSKLLYFYFPIILSCFSF